MNEVKNEDQGGNQYYTSSYKNKGEKWVGNQSDGRDNTDSAHQRLNDELAQHILQKNKSSKY